MAGMYPDNQELNIFGEKVQWPGVDSSGKFSNGSFQNPLEKPSFIPAETINLITVAATANAGIMRDASGRAKVAAPKADDDIARKAEVDSGKDDTLKSAKSYTDQMVQDEAQARVQGDADTLSSAKKYTDELLIAIFQNGYIQWPWMPKPETVFYFKGYRWAEVNYDGCFFRAKGKGANPFNGEEQGDAIRNITGTVAFDAGNRIISCSGVFKTVERGGDRSWTADGYWEKQNMSFDASRVVPTADENRSRNKTFIIWQLKKI